MFSTMIYPSLIWVKFEGYRHRSEFTVGGNELSCCQDGQLWQSKSQKQCRKCTGI